MPRGDNERNKKYIIGIDEAGRGPLAGPLAVGLVAIPTDFDFTVFCGVEDSKVLTHDERVEWYEKLSSIGDIYFNATFIDHKVIEHTFLSKCTRIAISRLLRNFDHTRSTVFLDGLLKAPRRFDYQRTVIKGDKKIPVISLASIVAKVERDRRMLYYAKKFPQYGFERHKGYATPEHRENIAKFGACAIHRKRFISSLTHK